MKVEPNLINKKHSKKGLMRSETHIDTPLVRRLLAAQFPKWADLRLEKVDSGGTDNTIYRLGNDLAVRLPRLLSASGQVDKELRWLPTLGPHLPLEVPVPLAAGMPSEEYTWHWSIVPWIKGEVASIERIENPHQAAASLGHFISALHQIDATGGPRSGVHNSFRGVPLIMRDTETREAIAKLAKIFNANALTAAWESALQAPEWHGPDVWVHGDLYSGNLLAEKGRLSAVIDFGLLGVGDPACDLMVAWTLLPAEARDTFRSALSVDDATWARGRGWALSFGLIALAYYMNTNFFLIANTGRYAIEEVLSEHRRKLTPNHIF